MSRPRVTENGFLAPFTSFESEKAIHEYISQTPVRSTDDHLVEFSEAMRSKKISLFPLPSVSDFLFQYRLILYFASQ